LIYGKIDLKSRHEVAPVLIQPVVNTLMPGGSMPKTTYRTREGELNRREFLYLGAMATAGVVAGCAVNPVTGQSQLMLVSEEQEIQLDRQNSPHQFSADYGTTQDAALNRYVADTGKTIAAQTHRKQMPYAFHTVNATYVNAYAFPGGSIGVTRGILLKLNNEAELAALLGHELGHVNARHTAEQMSRGVLTQTLVAGASIFLSTKGAGYGQLSSTLGTIGAGALLAHYSRDNEREADALGMEYMVRSRYSPQGMVGLMEMLNGLNKQQSNSAAVLFSTHPMSNERLTTAVQSAQSQYKAAAEQPLHRERFKDRTAALRSKRGAIEHMQAGEKEMAKKRYSQAESHFASALQQAPNDYAGLLMMSKCLMAQNKKDASQRYAAKAKQVYPQEAQAYQMTGMANLHQNRYAAAFKDFETVEQRLPGNPNTFFLKGYAAEKMGERKRAANAYYRYLQMTNQGDPARYAYQRLVQWGYVR
jgi:predicted Zn-dependent protease